MKKIIYSILGLVMASNILAEDLNFIAIQKTGDSTTVTLKAPAGYQSYRWDLGTTTQTDFVDTMNYKFNEQGRYNVCLTVKSNTGELISKCKTIEISSKLSVGNTAIAANQLKFLTNLLDPYTREYRFTPDFSQNDSVKYYWEFGDGNTSTLYNPTNKYALEGLYLVKLQIYDPKQDVVFTYSDVLKAGNAECQAITKFYIDETDSMTIHCTDSSKGTNEVFWFIDGQTYTNKNITHKFQKTGIYDVVAVALNNTTYCMDYNHKQVRVGQFKCNANFTYFIDSASKFGYFKNSSIGTSEKLQWVFGDGRVSYGNNAAHKFKEDGYYNVRLTVKTDNCIDSHEEKVLIGSENKDCEADFISVSNLNDSILSFRNQSKGKNLTYQWFFGKNAQFAIGEDTAIHPKEIKLPNGSGYYNICLTATNKNNPKISNTTCKQVKAGNDNGDINLTPCLADFDMIVDTASLSVTVLNKSMHASANSFEPVQLDFGDGSDITKIAQGNELSVYTHTYSSKDLYIIKLKTPCAGNTANFSEKQKLANLSSNQKIRVRFSYVVDSSSKLKATGYPVDFVAISHGDAAKLKWDFNGDGIYNDSLTDQPNADFIQSGDSVCVIIEDPITGDSDVYCQKVYNDYNSIKTIEASILSRFEIFPNPTSENTSIKFSLSETSTVNLDILSFSGNILKSIQLGKLNVGEYSQSISVKDLQSGAYLVRLNAGKSQTTKPLLIIRK